MKNPTNKFKAALKSGQHQLGIWNSLGGNTIGEMLAGCGFDWVLVDTEHSPIEATEVQLILQAIAGYPDTSAIVRPRENNTALIKRFLDMGAQTLLIPYIETADEARAAVSAMRYAPAGVRGMAAASRATRYGAVDNYAATASEELCLIVQAETKTALENLAEIATVDGVDGVFIGPADLAASLGYPGQSSHPVVVAAIEDAIARLNDLNVPSGILTSDEALAARYMLLGTAFTAVGIDLTLLVNATRELRARF
jgi:4-hydroxy-2-oxoheptanedioate aldolase